MSNAVSKSIMAASMLFAAGTTASAGDNSAVAGYWVSESKSVVEIKPCTEGSSRLCGDRVWVQGSDAASVTLLRGFREVRGIYTKGKVIDAETGKKRDGRFQLQGDGTLKVSTCKRNLCRHETWQRPDATMAEVPAEFHSAGE